MQVGIAAALALLLLYNLFFRLPPLETLFGEGMMFLYYAYAVPITARIERGFYRDGVWSDRGFVTYRPDRRASRGARPRSPSSCSSAEAAAPPAAWSVPGQPLRRRPPPASRFDRPARHPPRRPRASTSASRTSGKTLERR